MKFFPNAKHYFTRCKIWFEITVLTIKCPFSIKLCKLRDKNKINHVIEILCQSKQSVEDNDLFL